LKAYDYSQPSGYFVTICTKNKEYILGAMGNESMRFSAVGNIVRTCWEAIPDHLPDVELDQWIIMPNHLHGIIIIHDHCRGEAFAETRFLLEDQSANASPLRHPKGTTPRSLGAIIQNFKSVTTRKVNQIRATPGLKLWQRGFYDRIIRNKAEFDRVRKYIKENPLKWELDPYHPYQYATGSSHP
jgi:REP element-mobilizing transposase RayT